MINDFYRAFEDKHRGSRELIKSRLEAYLPFITPLKNIEKLPRAVDLGCGRGEWLELLAENGFDACGVDIDDGMLAACVQLGLKSEKYDAVAYLHNQLDQSIDIVSGFHIAEHLPFEVLQTLTAEALRVLKPSGILILETPNPENIIVGSKNFYLDPTHERPIPPDLLSFLIEHTGFFRVKVVRLQEAKDLATNEHLSLMNVLAGVSPDYSIVAQKQNESSAMEQFDSAFNHEYGISLDFLADAYGLQLDMRVAQAEGKAEQAQERAASAEAQAQQAQERAASAEAQAQQAQERAASAETQAQQAQERAASAEASAQQAQERAASAETQAQQAQERAASAEASAQQAQERAASAEQQAQQAQERSAAAEAKTQQAEKEAELLARQLHEIYKSTSWRITRPLRQIMRALYSLK